MGQIISYYHTGRQRATVLIIDKKIAGESVTGYPRTYNLGNEFKDYPWISSSTLMLISHRQYETRLIDFVEYVVETEEIPSGIINTDNATKMNFKECSYR